LKQQNKDLLANPEDIYKIKIDNIENFQDILKNKTLNDLEHLPDKPIDLPLHHQNSNKIRESKRSSLASEKLNNIKKADEKPNIHKANNFLKENNSLLSDINKKENFRFLNKLSDSNNFDLLKFRQHNFDKESKDDTDNKTIILNNYNSNNSSNTNTYSNSNSNSTLFNLNDKSELQQALENKIKNYYLQNKNYKNLTSLDKKILGIVKFEKDVADISSITAANEKNNLSSLVKTKENSSNKVSIPAEANKDQNLLTTLIQNSKANIGSDLKEIANKFLKEKPKKKIDLKGNLSID